jgi:hypothetical protein
MSVFASLQEATEPGPGEGRQLAKMTAHHTMSVFLSAPAITCVVYLEGSHDGDNWMRIATMASYLGGFTGTQPTGGLMAWIRANLAELNGEGVTVTATIASADDI